MSRPRLTAAIIDGLATMAGLYGAGSPSDVGFDDIEDGTADAQRRKAWQDVQAAIDWIRAVASARRTDP